MVEPGRIELPSENAPRKASTGLVHVLYLAFGWVREQTSQKPARILSRDWLSRQQPFASLMGFDTRIRIIRHPPSRCGESYVAKQYLPKTRQPLHIHNCHWQLCACWVLTRPPSPSTCNFGLIIPVETRAAPFKEHENISLYKFVFSDDNR